MSSGQMKSSPKSASGKTNERSQPQSQQFQIRHHADLVPGLRRLPRSDCPSPRRWPSLVARRKMSPWCRASAVPHGSRLYQLLRFHGVHGRSLAVAAGLKVARPDLTVMAMSGDGDGFSIGGNHFLHACRRNVDMTYIVMDNRVYGMTKGQPSPTTESDWDSACHPAGPGCAPSTRW